MIVDYLHNNDGDANEKFSISKRSSKKSILEVISNAIPSFREVVKNHPNSTTLNEDGYTQELVKEINKHSILNKIPFLAQPQYIDSHFGSKGKPDVFFYYLNHSGVYSPPLFIVECKRLPSKTFETEYVIGERENGGIERIKILKHGLGFSECGLIGFVEENEIPYWINSINIWIDNCKTENCIFNNKEKLPIRKRYSKTWEYIASQIDTKEGDKVLHHFLINLQ